MINCNLTSNNYLAPPAGFPFRLYKGQETAQAFVPKGTVTVVATIKPDYVADVHMALFAAPTSTTGSDGAPISGTQVNSTGVRASQPVTLTVTIPTTVAPAEYVVRVWYDNASGGTSDTIVRDTAITDVTKQVKLPYGVSVTSFTIT
jgi:hypothetical protein